MKTDSSRQAVECLMAEVRAAPARFPDAQAVIRRSGFGATRLSEILRADFGTTPAELLLQARLETAKTRLRARADESVARVAVDTGFESLSVFHDAFRRYTGLTPGAYRRTADAAGCAYAAVFTVPFGRFSLAVDAEGGLRAAAFGETAVLAPLLPQFRLQPDGGRTAEARAQIEAYFRDGQARFSLPLRPAGTPFQKKVWSALVEIPSGETRSYGQIALRLRSSPRAVGRAIATNPICLVVPCHRVIGADGSLTGYAYGVDLKRRLLAHEAKN